MFVKIKDHPNLVRDTKTNSIINVDEKSYVEYKRKKALAKQKLVQEVAKDDRINTLEQKVLQLEQLLTRLLEDKNNGNS